MKVMIVGDVHGYWGTFKALLQQERPDLVLQTGDFGYLPHIAVTEGALRRLPYDPVPAFPEGGWPEIRFVDGNHEDHDSLHLLAGDRLEAVEIAGGVYYQPRGSTVTLQDGRRILFFGGAASIDKHGRVQGRDWFPEEIPSPSDVMRLPDGRIDIVISHTCPARFIDQLVGKLRYAGYDRRSDPTCETLDAIFERYRPAQWFFGHWHWRFSAETDGCRWTCLHMLPRLAVANVTEPPLRAAWAWIEAIEEGRSYL